MSIKYYQLAKDEELPDEFCAVSVDGEPSEYTFYVPETENAKLRELVRDMWHEGMCECGSRGKCASCEYDYPTRMRELGIEVDE